MDPPSTPSHPKDEPMTISNPQDPKNHNTTAKTTQKHSILMMDDCDRPACEETLSALSAALERIGPKMVSNHTSDRNTIVSMECPPSKDVIGRSTWTLLHSMAAWYPEHPTAMEQTKMKHFIHALSSFYPCTYCAVDFAENLKKYPVQTRTRKDLCLWLCEQHNIVNEKLGKPLFHCTLDQLDSRWKKSTDPQKCGEKKTTS